MDNLLRGPTRASMQAAADRALSLPTSLSSHRTPSLREPVELQLRTRWMREAAEGALCS